MSKHTKGPWRAHKPEESNGYVYVDTDGKSGDIAVCYGPEGDEYANARLIAAAPDLLAALVALLQSDWILGKKSPNREAKAKAIKRAEKAILKAEGVL
jgi:hypothetical protein